MKIVWATDIHLPFASSIAIKKFFNKVNNSGADILLIAGDIAEGPSLESWLSRLDVEINIPIYFVLGNHDFYDSSIVVKSNSVSKLCTKSNKLCWLSEKRFIKLNDNTALIGHDGWYDTRNGDLYGGIILNDFGLIAELRPFSRNIKLLSERCKELALVSTKHFKKSLSSALKKFNNVILVTHVPPFKEATWHEGNMSDPSFLPWYSSKKSGEVITSIMKNNLNKHLTILCGHTHSFGEVDILPNLKVITGKAIYYYPDIQEVIDVP